MPYSAGKSPPLIAGPESSGIAATGAYFGSAVCHPNALPPIRTGSATIAAMWRKAIDFGVYLVVRLMIAVVQALPLEACERGAEAAGHVLRPRARHSPARRRRKSAHRVSRTYGRRARRNHLANVAALVLMIAEIAHTPRKVHETNWKEHSHIVNQELFVRTLLCRPAAGVDLRPLRQLRARRLPDGPVRLPHVHRRPPAR